MDILQTSAVRRELNFKELLILLKEYVQLDIRDQCKEQVIRCLQLPQAFLTCALLNTNDIFLLLRQVKYPEYHGSGCALLDCIQALGLQTWLYNCQRKFVVCTPCASHL